MAATQLVSVEEYLHTIAEHDVEYVDGKIIFRPLPQKSHSRLQTYLVRALYEVAHPLGFEVWVEQRIQTQTNQPRFRVPEVCVTLGEPPEQIFTNPPYLCIEILSPDDSAIELRLKIAEYLAFGVSYVWIIDPNELSGEIYTKAAMQPAQNSVFQAGDIAVDLRRV